MLVRLGGVQVAALWRWALDLTREPSSLERANRPERKRAGVRRLLHVLHEHRHYNLPDAVADLRVPVLVLRGRDDALTTPGWPPWPPRAASSRSTARTPSTGGFRQAWSAPIRAFAAP